MFSAFNNLPFGQSNEYIFGCVSKDVGDRLTEGHLMISVAVVGIGYWGKNLVRVFADISAVKTCVHTGGETNQQWLADNFPGIAVTTAYETVLRDPEIDAIVIATPTETHYELARQAMLAGKDVFVEKPLTDSMDRSHKLATLARETDQILFVGYIFCHHPTIQPLLERAKSHSLKWGLFSWEKLGAFNRDIRLDLVTHPVSLALVLFQGDPERAELTHSIAVTESTDILSARLQFSEGRQFDIRINRVSPDAGKYLQLLFENGELYYWTEDGLYLFAEAESEYQLVEQTADEPLRAECQQFVSAVKEQSDPRTTGEFGYRVDQIIDELR